MISVLYRVNVSPEIWKVKTNSFPTLLSGCSLVFSTLLLLAEQEVVGAAGLLGSTTPNVAFPRSPILGWGLATATGLEVLSLVDGARWVNKLVFAEACRVDEAVLARRVDEAALACRVDEAALACRVDEAALACRVDEAALAGRVDEAALAGRVDALMLLPLSRRRWTAGGSCFMGLSWTQKVSRLMGLSVLAVWPSMPSLASTSCTNSSLSVVVSVFMLVVLSSSLCGRLSSLPCSWSASLWASWHTASSWSPDSGLQLPNVPIRLPSSRVATLTETHFSVWLTGPTNTSSSSSSPLELQSRETPLTSQLREGHKELKEDEQDFLFCCFLKSCF